MANDDVKKSITGWCTAADDLQLVEERSEPDSDFTLHLRTNGGDGADLLASVATGTDRLLVRHTASIAGDALKGDGGADTALATLVEGRPGPVTAWTSEEGGQRTVLLQTWVYLDGLNKHTFMSAVSEITRTRNVLDRLTGNGHALATPTSKASAAPQPAATPAPEPVAVATPVAPAAQVAPSPAPAEAPAGLPQPVAQGMPVPVAAYPQPAAQPAAYTPQPQPQPQAPAPQPQAAAWTPTHKVPGQGMQAWAQPDPSGAVVANLGGNLPVQVMEMRGAWANVLCSNGWAGWVDARLLTQGG